MDEDIRIRFGLARNFISMVETGQRNVTIATVSKLARALQCRMADLMPDAGDATALPAPQPTPSKRHS